MTIEIHEPELEALIHKRMASGRFHDIEDLLMHTLERAPEAEPEPAFAKQSFTQFLMDSPLYGADLIFERQKDSPRPADL